MIDIGICKICGGYIIPPKIWMSVIPPKLCKTKWKNFQYQGCK